MRNSYASYIIATHLFVVVCLYNITTDSENHYAPFFLALLDNKAMVLLLAVALWKIFTTRSFKEVTRNKTIQGIMLGFAVFALFGLIVSPTDFLTDGLMQHGLSRFTLQKPDLLGPPYPSLGQLWKEFSFNFGYLFVGLSFIAMVWLARRKGLSDSSGMLTTFVALASVLFSVIDWKNTKHLNLMVPALILIQAYFIRELWNSKSRGRIVIGVLLILAMIAYNVFILTHLIRDFAWLQITPGW